MMDTYMEVRIGYRKSDWLKRQCTEDFAVNMFIISTKKVFYFLFLIFPFHFSDILGKSKPRPVYAVLSLTMWLLFCHYYLFNVVVIAVCALL